MTELYQDHLTVGDSIQHVRVEQMQEQNLRPEYEELRTVESESKPQMYLLGRISVLRKPFTKADIAEDRIANVFVCSCDDFHYHRSKGFENGDVSVTELGECKHITAEVREKRAQADESQRTL